MPPAAKRKDRGDGKAELAVSAAAGKRPRHDLVNNSSGLSTLSGSVLHNKADAQLLPWLFECHRVLRAATPPLSVDPAFVRELLSPRYLKSTLNGVQQMTGCLLSDLVRLSNDSSTSGAENVFEHLFDVNHADDILLCLTSPFEPVARGEASLKTCEHLIERACASHIFLSVIPHCRQPIQERLTYLFASIQQAGGISTEKETASNSDSNSNNTITTTTAVEMGRVLVDILNATKTISPEQLAPLLKAITAASPTLLRRTEANRQITNSSGSGSSPAVAGSKTLAQATAQKRRSPGAVIAARILLEQLDVIHPAICGFVVDIVEQGVREVTAAEVTDDNMESKRHGLRCIGRGMEYLVALMELHLDLVSELVPALLAFLQHDNSDIRLLFLRGYFMAFGSHESAISTYRSAFTELLTRFNDPKYALRIEIVQLSANAITAATLISTSFAEERIREFLPFIEIRLVDPHALVRRAAVVAYGDIITAAPSLVPSDRMERTLGLRVADKNPKVRQAAVERLCGVYQRLLYPWIPNEVMKCLNAEGGVSLLESCFESLLPPPSRVTPADASFNNNNNNNNNNTSSSASNQSSSSASGRRSARASMVVFDFEKESATQERTYVEGFAKLCSHLNSRSFEKLLTFAAKKAQLRLSILRLFQLRADVRSKDLKSPEGQEMINNIHRLLNFLQTMTHAEKGEWDALFRSKDDKISKSFLSCCADEHNRYATERDLLIKTLKGRVDGHVLKFVQETLCKQMMFPIELDHMNELLARVRGSLRGVCNDKNVTVDAEMQCNVEGQLRALLVFGRTAPSFLPHVAVSLVDFVELICQSTNSSIPISWIILLLNCVTEWAKYTRSAVAVEGKGNKKDNNASTSDSIITARKKALFTALGRLCSCSHEPFIQDAAPEMVGAVCKHAARCFVAVLSVRGMQDPKAINQLVHSLAGRIRDTATPTSSRAVGWLKALTAFAKDRAVAPLLQDESLVHCIKKLLLMAICDKTETEDLSRVKSKQTDVVPTSVAAGVVDAASKCLTVIALSYPADRIAGAVNPTLNIFLAAYKENSERESSTVGACHRRISINKQLAKLVIRPSSDISKELAVAVILSAEDEVMVRRAVQKKITSHIMQNNCDMRYVALLILTVISEETKNGYQYLRSLIQQVGDHLRLKQRSSGATLSTPDALICYLEYTLPFLVFFMAHHTFYSSEQENHFVAYQRVWHLLFDELFRHGTQCASFVVELLSRIKQAEDVIDRESHATRVLCDLGSRVMQETLGQRQIGADALKRYPGRILLPNFFASSSSAAEVLNTIFLDAKVHIFSHVPFRAPAVAAAAGVAEEKAVSLTRGMDLPNNEEKTDNDNNNSGDNGSTADSEINLPPLIRQRIDKTLETFIGSMTQEEIVKVRSKDLKKCMKQVMISGDADGNGDSDNDNEEENVTEANVVEYAMKQLRQLYEKAPRQ